MNINILIIIFLLIGIGLTFLLIFRKGNKVEENEVVNFTIESLVEKLKITFNRIINENPYETVAKKVEADKREQLREQLDENVRVCYHGDKVAKAYVKDIMKSKLQINLHISESTINIPIPFDDYEKLSKNDRFSIVLHLYKNKYGKYAFDNMMQENKLDELKGSGRKNDEFRYEVTEEDIKNVYMKLKVDLSYLDRLELLTQKAYSMSYGIGIIDELRDMVLDGISAGLSGLKEDDYDYIEDLILSGCSEDEIEFVYDSIMVLYRGKTIKMSCIGFESEEELERISKKIYKYEASKYLSENEGIIVTDAADGSRITVARPKVAENWAFFIRMFKSVPDIEGIKLVTDQGAEKVINAVELFTRGMRTICICGDMTAGKTTLLKLITTFIDTRYGIRVDELMFELHLKKFLKHHSILTMREYGEITGQEIYEFFKKTDAIVGILGEATTPVQASYAVQYVLSGFKCVFFTNHSPSAEDVVDTVAFGLLQQKIYPSNEAAERMAAKKINIVIHNAKTPEGHIYYDKISEIIPIKNSTTEQFKVKDLIVFENGEYVVKDRPTEKTEIEMFAYYTDREKKMYEQLFASIAKEAIA